MRRLAVVSLLSAQVLVSGSPCSSLLLVFHLLVLACVDSSRILDVRGGLRDWWTILSSSVYMASILLLLMAFRSQTWPKTLVRSCSMSFCGNARHPCKETCSRFVVQASLEHCIGCTEVLPVRGHADGRWVEVVRHCNPLAQCRWLAWKVMFHRTASSS